MTDFQKAVAQIAEEIKRYRKCVLTDGEKLNKHLQQISAILFYLETERARIHDLWQNKVNQLILEGSAVNRAENQAHVLYPEMYLLRRVMDSAYTNVDSIRTNISWLKSEKRIV